MKHAGSCWVTLILLAIASAACRPKEEPFPRMWMTVFPSDEAPQACDEYGGMDDFLSVPGLWSSWESSLSRLDALLTADYSLVDADRRNPAYLPALGALHVEHGLRLGLESYFACVQEDPPRWQFDPQGLVDSETPWYTPIDRLVEIGEDEPVIFLDTFDAADAAGVDLMRLDPDEYAGPIADEIAAVRARAPRAAVAIHMLVPYERDPDHGRMTATQIAQIEALKRAADARAAGIDAILFDSTGVNPEDLGSTEIDAIGLRALIDAAHAEGMLAGVILMSFVEWSPEAGGPPWCGFPRSGMDFQRSVLAGLDMLQAGGIEPDFYDLSSWTWWPRRALPETEQGTMTNTLLAVEEALAFAGDS